MSEAIREVQKKDLPEIREIFFESSTKKDFKDESEKEQFFYKYVGYYLEHFPDLALVYEYERILGYILGAPISDDEKLFDIQPHMRGFMSHFKDYPSHLHINCHFESRGKGVGKKLVQALEKLLTSRNIKGLHIMTGIDSANKTFYHKLGFNFEVVGSFKGSPILLMGKNL